jgi:hypothetical protein
MHTASLRATAVALLAGGLLMPAATFAAPTPDTGTVVGTVTCGPAEDAPAAHIVVAAEGVNLQTLTDGTGKFSLVGLPALQAFTIDAVADPQGSDVTSRFNVVVQPGETLDIGSMDLAICGQPAQPTPAQDQQPTENTLDQ